MLIRDRAAAALAADPIYSTLGLTPEQQRLFTWAWSAGYAEGLADKQRDTPVSSGSINPLYHGFVSIDAGYMKQEAAPDAQEGGKEAQTDRRCCGNCRYEKNYGNLFPCYGCRNFSNWKPK